MILNWIILGVSVILFVAGFLFVTAALVGDKDDDQENWWYDHYKRWQTIGIIAIIAGLLGAFYALIKLVM